MRLPFLFAALLALAPVAAAADPPDAQAAFAERRALLQIDARCRLLPRNVRAAVEAGALQARGALLRAGWSSARLADMERSVDRAARERACADPRTQAAAAEAREAFAAWAATNTMNFPGWARSWTARRSAGPNGWRLSQDIDSPVRAAFGVRETQGAQNLALTVAGEAATTARLRLRDASRSRAGALDLPQRVAYGLAAGAPAPDAITRSFTATARSERRSGGVQTVYLFPDEAFRALLALDPRESVEIDLLGGRVAQRLYVEVGDIAAARAFLALRAD